MEKPIYIRLNKEKRTGRIAIKAPVLRVEADASVLMVTFYLMLQWLLTVQMKYNSVELTMKLEGLVVWTGLRAFAELDTTPLVFFYHNSGHAVPRSTYIILMMRDYMVLSVAAFNEVESKGELKHKSKPSPDIMQNDGTEMVFQEYTQYQPAINDRKMEEQRPALADRDERAGVLIRVEPIAVRENKLPPSEADVQLGNSPGPFSDLTYRILCNFFEKKFRWQAIDYARLNYSTVSFFNFLKPETAASRWNRVSLNASKVGKGLSKDTKAQKLAFQHWIEAIDPRHRYGHSLHLYYEEWCKTNAGQPFFYWLDLGDGKEVDLKECPRSKLRQQCIKYLGPQERELYEYVVVHGKILHKQTGIPLDTNNGSLGLKWIFVMSTSKRLYTGEKKKGYFHHSSFLAGGTTLAAGRLVVEDGVLKVLFWYFSLSKSVAFKTDQSFA
ncbi:IQ domain-containing protein IQM2-like [Olea europaea var. sylvestris]|uniref:IQ domain-containing protein IQM2-like n=1 Tax=Olea europaea var. sylvestris TaxID=158386 RepID=UPI000C1D2630|nr:IQ domain-containing protein IQM2-like [Olea europaea var. sylvestris]